MDFKAFFFNTIGVFMDVGIGVITVTTLMNIISAKSKMMNNLRNGAQGLTQRARDRAQATGFYQRREIARNQRKGERQRSGVESYAGAITYGEKPGETSIWRRARAARLRQRAGGRSAEAQNRAYVSGLGQVEKLESQETRDAEFVLKSSGITGPANWATIAEGGTVNGITGAGNPALQRAAIRKIIAAQDGGGLDRLVQSNSEHLDRSMLVQEMQDHYQDTKAAGAHFVGMTSIPDTGFDLPTVQNAAVTGLAGLAHTKLATQDDMSAKRAVEGFTLAARTTLADRQKLWDSIERIYGNPETLSLVKDKTRVEFDKIFTAPPVGSAPGTAPIHKPGMGRP